MPTLSARGKIEIAREEGICLRRYLDSVGVWTWGIGHTAHAGDPDPKQFKTDQTLEYVLEVFHKDMVEYDNDVQKHAGHLNLNQHEHDALVGFTYNLGAGNLRQLVKGRSKGQVARAILRYNRAGGKYSAAIAARREREYQLFMKGKYGSTQVPVFPVDNKTERPIYRKARIIDLKDYI